MKWKRDRATGPGRRAGAPVAVIAAVLLASACAWPAGRIGAAGAGSQQSAAPGTAVPARITPAGTASAPTMAPVGTTAVRVATPTTPAAATTAPVATGDAGAACLAGSAAGPYLASGGGQITCDGLPVRLTGFTFYPALVGGSRAWHRSNFRQYIDHVLDMGAAAGQNLVRPTDEWDRHTAGQTAEDPVVWANMDYLVQAAAKRHMFVVMDLSAYRWLLESQGRDPLDPTAWTGFIRFVAARYRNAANVAFYSILGEPAPPHSTAELQQLLDFYRTTTATLRAADPHHLVTAGGFNHMEDERPGLEWWQAIDALPGNDLVAFKTYSQHDLALLPTIAAYAASVGKPAVDEEFGMPQGFGDGRPTPGMAFNGITTGRARFFSAVYATAGRLGVDTFVIWNLGCQVGPTSYEVSPLTPAAWAVVAKYGAVAPTAARAGKPLCPTTGGG
jgi:hypothetical protein